MSKPVLHLAISLVFLLIEIKLNAQQFSDNSVALGVTEVVSGSVFGSGLSTFDFNNDGLDDISMSSSYGQLKFYKNVGDGFELQQFEIYAAGVTEHVLWVDFDNDNDVDIYFTTNSGSQFLYRNNGDFVFENVTESAGLDTHISPYYGASFADYDLDGDLDLYVGKYSIQSYNPNDDSHQNKLYQNQGDGTFTDVTESSGMLKIPTFTFQPTWFDYNSDGWPDLHVINDRIKVNFLFRNNGDGTFTDVAEELSIQFGNQDVMSNSICDFDLDGDPDIYMTNTGTLNPIRLNILLVNQGDGTFTEEAVEYGIGINEHTWGALWIDADNDTWPDLMIASEFNNPIYYFINNEGQSFTLSNQSIDYSDIRESFSPSKGDFNNDGFSDVAIQTSGQNHPYVLINEGGSNSYIKITLEGTISNKQAIGSSIEVFLNDNSYKQYTHCGENYLGQNSQHLIFGLGENIDMVDSVKITYPSRHEDVHYSLPTNLSYQFIEGETYACNISTDLDFTFCEGDSIELDAGNHYSYLWSNGDTTRTTWVNSTSEYWVTVQSQYGILASDTVQTIQSNIPLITSIIEHPLCFGDSTGSIELINQYNIAADNVIWDNNLNGTFIEGLPAGEFEYSYTDINGCITIGSATLLQPSGMQFFTTLTPETDENSNGSILISIFGGTPPYEITLGGEIVAEEISGLSSGDYIFEIIDSNYCSDTLIATVDFVTNIGLPINENITIYPNPAFHSFSISSDHSINKIKLYSPTSRLIKTYLPNTENKYSLEGVASGIYILRIEFEDHQVTTYKISKP